MTAIDLSNYFGLAAISCLSLNILLGLLLSTKYNPVRKWPHRRINTLQLHNWTGYTALVVSLVHPTLILFSSTAHFRIVDIVYPLNAPKQPYINAIGALALYLLVATVVTSYFRLEIGRRLWKPLHFATYALFVLYAVHSLLTDPTLKDAPFDPLDAEKVFVELCIFLVVAGIGLRIRWQSRQPPPRQHRPKTSGGQSPRASEAPQVTVLERTRYSRWFSRRALFVLTAFTLDAHALRAQGNVPDTGFRNAWRYDPDAGAVFQSGEVKWIIWGFAERYWGPKGGAVSADAWRRVRQGMELDLPRVGGALRPVFVYEVDVTNNNFFRNGRPSQAFENLYFAIQNPDDASRFRALFGENTHILSREDNLSSGNLPTINRSLILEEHGSVNSFGTQWGVEVFRAMSARTTLAFSVQDNRGSLNTTHPGFRVGNSLAAKITSSVVRDSVRKRQLSVGFGADYTRAIYDRTFSLTSAIGAETLGGTPATGNKFTVEGDIAYASTLGSHPVSLEGEYLFSDFSHSLTDVSGGYVLFQMSIFDTPRWGDLDPFVRYDVVRLGREVTRGTAVQQAWRAGVNYNLPFTAKHASLHVEYALNSVTGPEFLVLDGRSFSEMRFEVRVNAARYLRH